MSRDPYESAFKSIHGHLNRHEKALGELQTYAKHIGSQPRHAPVQEPNDLDQLRAQEIHYANVVLLLGYGGFFALWGSCADRMHPWTFGGLGLAMGLSLLVFIAFEMLKTVSATMIHNKAARRGPDGQRLMTNRDYLRDLRVSAENVNAYWHWFFIPAVLLGVGAGFGLLVFFIRHTLGY